LNCGRSAVGGWEVADQHVAVGKHA
jgi:hypothetical protein